MSDTPLLERLQVKRGRTFVALGAPESVVGLDGAAVADAQDADVVLAFFADRAALEAQLPQVAAQTQADAILWAAYPKLTSPLAGDLNRNLIHALTPGWGLTTVSQIAVDADWSAMRLKRF